MRSKRFWKLETRCELADRLGYNSCIDSGYHIQGRRDYGTREISDMRMENKNVEKQISPDEIDAKIHNKVLTEERFLKWNIAIAAVFALLFLTIVILGIFRQNIRAVIIFGIITDVTAFAVIAYIEDYVKIKNKKYACYLCKVEEFIDHQYLRVNEDIIAVYDKADFGQPYVYPEEEDAEYDGREASFGDDRTDTEAILINSRDNNWYAFSMNWYRGI